MLLMKVREVKRDDCDYTLAVPLSILPGLNADFDGDILNIIGIVDKAIAYMFRKFDPIKRMIISRDNGLLNENFSIVKGQLIDLHVFCTINGGENDRPQTYYYKDEEGNELWLTKEEIEARSKKPAGKKRKATV